MILSLAMTPKAPPQLGRYEILDEIGKGAMGVVYLAKDPLIGRLVAIKTFRIGYSVRDEELEQFRKRFIREAQSAGILSHPNIVTVHDVVEESELGTPFIAMEYVRGTNLKELVRGGKPLPLDFVVAVVSQVAAALDYAHSMGVVHRDIKPANIMITGDERVKITDFGIARLDSSNLTTEGQLLGTPNYMAPEQILGKDVDFRADLFSLGVVLYEMLTCRKPFHGENLTVVSHRVVYDAFTPPEEYVRGFPVGIREVLARSLEKAPEARYASAGHLAEDLERAAVEASADIAETQDLTGFLPPVSESPAAATPPPEAARTPAPEEPSGVPTEPAAVADDSAAAPPEEGPAQAPAPVVPSRARRAIDPRRLAIATVTASALTLLVGSLLVAWVDSGEQPDLSLTADEQAWRRILPLVREGRRQLEAGEPEVAALIFARAERSAPGQEAVAALRREAEVQARAGTQAAVESEVTASVAAGQRALVEGRRREALEHAERALAIAPDDPEAIALRQAAERPPDRVVLRAAAPEAEAPPSEPVERPAPARTAAASRSEPAPAPSGPAAIQIDFFSYLPEGVLTVYVGDRQILRQPFRFVTKKGFLKTEPATGRVEASGTVPAGPATLRVYVALPGLKKTELVTLDAELPPGRTSVLKAVLDKDAELRVSVE